MSNSSIGFIGMSHLGINTMVALANRGFDVWGFDPNKEIIDLLEGGDFPFSEPDLLELADKNRKKIQYSSNSSALSDCDLVYISLDIPTNDNGLSDLEPAKNLIDIALSFMNSHSILVILSQVPPGFTRSIALPKERLFYQVETLIFGCAIERALYPERIIVGSANPSAPLPETYAKVLETHNCPILPMRYESAELCKISINMFLVSSVTTSNIIADLCERLGADWADIIPALRYDKRIGEHAYLTPGLGISGGNLERDLNTFHLLADEFGSDARPVTQWINNSKYRKNWPFQRLSEEIQSIDNPRISVLGLAYKENTNSTKNSPALELLASIPNFDINVYDPVVEPSPRFHPHMTLCTDALTACKNANILLILTPWDEFNQLDPAAIAKEMDGNIVIDPYGVLNQESCETASLVHHVLGRKT